MNAVISKYLLTCLLATLWLGMLWSQPVHALRCDGALVSVGETKLEVQKKCGKPTWQDRWVEETTKLPDTDFEYRISRLNERWIYNFGPTQFLQIVTFRDSRVSNIETGGRGFLMPLGKHKCDLNVFSLGTSSAEIALQCGEPDWKERRFETVTGRVPGGREAVTVSIDEWTYDLGANQFIRILTFRNGDLIDIRTGGRGFE